MLPSLKLVVGVEDTPYFHWQLPVLLESVRGQIDVVVALCTEWGVPSETMARIESAYDVRIVVASNPGKCLDIDVSVPGARYAALNRIEALNAVAPILADDDIVYLAETDVFLFGDVNPDVIPRGNALQANALIAQDRFMQEQPGGRGIDLRLLLRALGRSEPFQPGGVSVFLDAPTVRDRKFRQDCSRFAQILFLAGHVVEAEKNWYAEMACFALALHANRIPYEVVDRVEFTTDVLETVPPGSFYHFYHDPRDGGGFGAFRGESWHKHAYRFQDFLRVTSCAEFDALVEAAVTEHARQFFRLARAAKARLYPEDD